MALHEFRLPDPGEGLVEADIVTWHVKVGDEVKVNDVVVEVETSKSLVELPIPYAGKVSALLVNEGDTVDVGTPIIVIDDGVPAEPGPGEDTGRPDDLVPELPPTEAEQERVAVLVGYGARASETKRRARKGDPVRTAHDHMAAGAFPTDVPVSRRSDHRAPLEPHPAHPQGEPLPGPGESPSAGVTTGGRPLAKPPVRKLAKDLGVDLTQVPGTGRGGVITREDVQLAAQPEPQPEPESVPTTVAPVTLVPGQDVRIPIRGVRKATAEAMIRSAFTAPHVTEWVTLDVTGTVELVERLRARREFADVKVTPMLVIAKAVCLALGRTPSLNSSWDEDTQEIVQHGSVNLGIAAATPRGLVVPNIKDADQMTLLELGEAFTELVRVARAGKTTMADMSRGTFTITNVGTFGVDGGTPILNPGEAGILCVGQFARRPWVIGTGEHEQIVPRWVATISVSFDHRVVDGEQGSRFLADVAQVLNDPGLGLLF
jgi:2-oxoisovalerate dehydrogenase E2 component (dihydrolipoyl transacylase)